MKAKINRTSLCLGIDDSPLGSRASGR
ncbi:hypothetical protein LCGC14_1956700, partial [marine sediment metagenome]